MAILAFFSYLYYFLKDSFGNDNCNLIKIARVQGKEPKLLTDFLSTIEDVFFLCSVLEALQCYDLLFSCLNMMQPSHLNPF